MAVAFAITKRISDDPAHCETAGQELTVVSQFAILLSTAIRSAGPVLREPAMADKHMMIGRVINATGMIGVSSGVVLFTFGIVLLLFRRGFGFDVPSFFHWFWQ
jgi:hypothetical protein